MVVFISGGQGGGGGGVDYNRTEKAVQKKPGFKTLYNIEFISIQARGQLLSGGLTTGCMFFVYRQIGLFLRGQWVTRGGRRIL